MTTPRLRPGSSPARTRVVTGIAAVMTALVVAACTGSAAPSSAAPSSAAPAASPSSAGPAESPSAEIPSAESPSIPADVSGSLTLWYTPYSPGVEAEQQWAQFNVDPFTAIYPNVEVKPVQVNGDTAAQKQQVALAAGSGPDIVKAAGPANVIPYAEAGYLEDLTGAAATYGWQDQLLPWAYDMGFVRGKLVALPTEYETLMLYYNKTLFEANGWAPPTDRASLLALIDKMKAKDVIPFSAGNADYQAATEWFVSSYLDQVAGPEKVHDALAGEIPWTDPAIQSAIQMMKDDFNAGFYGGSLQQYFSNGFDTVYHQLADGQAGMMMSGSWDLGGLPDFFGKDGNTNEWDWVPLPPMAEGRKPGMFPLSIGSTMSVNAKAASVDAANAYVAWFFSDIDNMWAAVKADAAAVYPVKLNPADIPDGLDPRFTSTYVGIAEASDSGNVGYTTWTSFGPKLEGVVVDQSNKVLTGDLSVADFTAQLQAAYEQDKADGLIPPLFSTGG